MDTPKLAQDLEGQLIRLKYGMAFAEVDDRDFFLYAIDIVNCNNWCV